MNRHDGDREARHIIIGRGAKFNPPNRFEEIHVARSDDDLAQYFVDPDPHEKVLTRFYIDHTKSVLVKNDSPDLGFAYSINPYRGCEHGCVYCYARPSHEYLGFSSGLDFETKILVKHDAPELLAAEFRNPHWQPQEVVLSGNTDCYQPVERTLGITRRCLEVFLKFRNPVSIITKNALIQRDIDILKPLAQQNLVFVIISITTLDQKLQRTMEPRTSAPAKRLEAIATLADAGIPVGVNVSPIIPGLTDDEMPTILRAAADHGVRWASYTVLRLPFAVKELFVEWLEREYPSKATRVLSRIRDVGNGRLSCSEFGKRMTGEGEYAEAIRQLFKTTCMRLRLNEQPRTLQCEAFQRNPYQLNLL